MVEILLCKETGVKVKKALIFSLVFIPKINRHYIYPSLVSEYERDGRADY